MKKPESSHAGRDLVDPFCDALRCKGIKVGIYFSHLDSPHPDYATELPIEPQPQDHAKYCSNPFAYPQGDEDPVAWLRFLEFHRAQLKELCERYKSDLLWFDRDWERDQAQWAFRELRDQLQHWAPGVVLNSRMGGYGDFRTPEQVIPVTSPAGPWEFCTTVNDHWGFMKSDSDHKPVHQCVRMLAECAGLGGNLLLDIGPSIRLQ